MRLVLVPAGIRVVVEDELHPEGRRGERRRRAEKPPAREFRHA
jgi:hypothetical protein